MIVRYPVFISPHARQRWRERVDPRASDREIEEAILGPLQTPRRVWRYGEPTTLLLVSDHPAIAVGLVAPTEGPWPVVTTIVRGGTLDRQLRAGIAIVQSEAPPPWPECRDRRAIRGARRAAQIAFVARYVGYRTVEWMARRLRRQPATIRQLIYTEGLAPTLRANLLTSGLAAQVLGCSQQWVTTLIRRGQLPAHRNPGGRYWLIEQRDLRAYLAAHGRESQDPLLLPRRRP